MLEHWNDGATKSAIVDFVGRVTTEGSTGYVAPDARIAVFDNDGTLWCEKPMPIQFDFIVRRFAEMAHKDPSLREQQPFKAAFDGDLSWLGSAITKHYQGDNGDLKVLGAAVTGAFDKASVEEYDARVKAFFADARHPSLNRNYDACGYAPMFELLNYLQDNGFTSYIASGGDRDFMRPIAGRIYGIPPERIIGSSLGLTYDDSTGQSEVLYKASMDFFDDGPEKPVRIWSRIGRRPILAVGNSNGDLQMLTFSGATSRPSLCMVIRHDDADREFDYTAGAEHVLEHARASGWIVTSIKNDWTTVFST